MAVSAASGVLTSSGVTAQERTLLQSDVNHEGRLEIGRLDSAEHARTKGMPAVFAELFASSLGGHFERSL